MVFHGTAVTAEVGRAVVTATAMATRMGQIAGTHALAVIVLPVWAVRVARRHPHESDVTTADAARWHRFARHGVVAGETHVHVRPVGSAFEEIPIATPADADTPPAAARPVHPHRGDRRHSSRGSDRPRACHVPTTAGPGQRFPRRPGSEPATPRTRR